MHNTITADFSLPLFFLDFQKDVLKSSVEIKKKKNRNLN